MSERVMPRASGQTAGEEMAMEGGKELAKDIEEAHLPIEDESSQRKFRTPGFHRMRFSFDEEQRMRVDEALSQYDKWLHEFFPDAYEILDDIFMIIRDPLIGPDGPERDEFGHQKWVRTITGHIHEDFSRLTSRHKEDLAYQIMTRLPSWEQMAAGIWTEAMYARVAWEEKFAIDYDAPARKTMGERDAIAKKGAIDERYFAVFMAGYSRKAEALVRTMRNLGEKMGKPTPL